MPVDCVSTCAVFILKVKMAGIIGSVNEFNETTDSWQSYVERIEHFFTANGIDSVERRKAVLLSCVGARTYKLLSNLVAPKKPGECTYNDIVETLTKHHNPRPFNDSSSIHGLGQREKQFERMCQN